jgi:hypothetical protein
VFAETGTADEKFACCQPEAVSPLNATLASRVPLLVQRFPMWLPTFALPL